MEPFINGDFWLYAVAFSAGIAFSAICNGLHKNTIILKIRTPELRERFDKMIQRTNCQNDSEVIRKAIPLFDIITEEETLGGVPYIHYPDGSQTKLNMT
jgi:hypothetical protein